MKKKDYLLNGDDPINNDELIAPEEDVITEAEAEPIGKVTDEQIAVWKAKYGRIFYLKGDGHICYIKKITRKILGYAGVIASTKDGSRDTIKYFEVILLNVFIGGSEEFKTNDKLMLGVGPQLMELVEVAEIELGEL